MQDKAPLDEDPSLSEEEPAWLDELLELVSGVGCLSCRQPYDPEQIEILARHEDAWLLVGYCEHCDMHQLVVVLLHTGEPQGATVVGEMTLEEWREALERPPIGEEDVERVAHILEGYRGDLISLLDD
ncbi:MAG: hypothetical protein ACP5UM_01715 [Anaerolineae bacterium]